MTEKDATMSTTRLVMFSDAVIAIIITLMVLSIKVPDVGNADTTAVVWEKLLGMARPCISYFLSFVMLGVMWVNHHQFFAQLRHADRYLLWLNLHLLFWICLIPIPTDLLGRNALRPEITAVYGLVMFMSLFSFLIMRMYVQRANLFIESVSLQMITYLRRKLEISVALVFTSIFAGFVSVYLAVAIFVSVGVIYFIPASVMAREKS